MKTVGPRDLPRGGENPLKKKKKRERVREELSWSYVYVWKNENRSNRQREREFVCACARLHSHIEAIRVVTEKKSDIQLVLFVISDLLVA